MIWDAYSYPSFGEVRAVQDLRGTCLGNMAIILLIFAESGRGALPGYRCNVNNSVMIKWNVSRGYKIIRISLDK